MKNLLLTALLLLLQASAHQGEAQGLQMLVSFRQESRPTVDSPMMMIEEMEKQLSAQFSTPIADHATVSILSDDKVVARGTVLSGFDQNFSYLVCPGDVLSLKAIRIQSNDGSIYEPSTESIQSLSRQDNLSILRIPRVPQAIMLSSLEPSRETGSFIGILGNEHSWKTGTVTNQGRSAITGGDPRMERSLQKHWTKIGLQVSAKRSGFPEVIESDLDLLPNEAGSPVFDRSGSWQGIAIARADRHATLLIPALRVAALIRDFEQEIRS